MFLSEMFDEYKKGYQSLENDKSQQKIEDLRKTRLTLAQINQLRKMNDQRSLEFKENLQKVKLMYGQSAAPAA
jgi:organic radical activating enzyme